MKEMKVFVSIAFWFISFVIFIQLFKVFNLQSNVAVFIAPLLIVGHVCLVIFCWRKWLKNLTNEREKE